MGKKITFSVEIYDHRRKGKPEQMKYDNTYHKSPYWKNDEFRVPEDGLYFMSVSFVRDSMVLPDGQQGTYDDSNIGIYVGEKLKAYAWAGSATIPRQPASTSVILCLSKDDLVTTRDWALGDAFRRFRHCVFTCYRIGDS